MSTGARNIRATGASQTVPLLNFHAMRQNVNESQRQGLSVLRDKNLGGHAPGGRVTAIPAPSPKVSDMCYPSQTIMGYSANHSQHANQTSAWSSRAYKGLTASQIGQVKINLYVYEPTCNAKGQPIIIHGIKEGLRVSSDISTRALSRLIRDTFHDPLLEYCGSVPFNVDDMVLRDSGWMKLDPYSEESYFGDMFLKPNPRKKDGSLIFSMPANAKMPIFGLVFNPIVWKEIEALREKELYNGRSHSPEMTGPTAGLLAGFGLHTKRKALASHGKGSRKAARKGSGIRKASPVSVDSDDSGRDSKEEGAGEDEHAEENPLFEDEHAEENPLLKEEDTIAGEGWNAEEHANEEEHANRAESVKAGPQNGDARFTTSVSTKDRTDARNQQRLLAPLRLAATLSVATSKRVFSFNPETLRQGFLAGGAKLTDGKLASNPYLHEPIAFHNLPQPTLAELIAEPTKMRVDMLGPDAEPFDAQLRYDPRPEVYLGVGSFKTTSPARLTFNGSHYPLTGLGMLAHLAHSSNKKGCSLSVALKRPYRSKRGGGMVRMPYAEEESAIFEECKLLIWANSLLKTAYHFMEHFMARHPSGKPPPFTVFQFRFVEAGMAIAQKPLDNSGPSPTTNRAAYLLEEMLPGEKTDFIKYLHNASAASELLPDEPDYDLAEFLMFIQHVQYAITGGLAYVSDFQDMSGRQLGNDLFGDGNLGEAFNLFPLQHQCNKYCEWFELQNPLEIAQMGDQLTTGNKKSLGKSKGKVSILGTQYNSD
ncbi:uncharacterized protein LACBIDRAFT_335167 [Laccaria bicolor S238N-H82]|uniref:Predicted protein n=1 Tax=Laccaria bicolor (strain S238N-H82 / ATCC MYA-4686) TaxID=486041 RepID=B0E1K2_LACBS|nr:uncharacterized protein LACBIDRAFT_335167 [Laccaria bicolor S238N-H82]EDQ99255.1 predicted protein [Laccaria bicolor S238N-H82]|eukprot:XP_001890065.1 predicted protein [Laccaria bicolor S238N-H82]